MDYRIVIGIVISIFIILLSVIFIIILFQKRNQFPYIYFNSFWERIILVLIVFSQIFCLFYNFIRNEKLFLFYKIIKILIVDVLICIAIIARSYNIYCLVYNNYLIISQNNYFQIDIKNKKGEKIFNENYQNQFIHFKLFLGIGLVMVILSFIIIKLSNDFTLFYQSYNNDEYQIFYLLLYSHFIYFVILISLFLIYSLISKNPIPKDKYFCKKEIIFLIIIIFLSTSIKILIILIINKQINLNLSLILDSIFNSLITLLYSILVIKRNRFFKGEDLLSLNKNDLDYFLSKELRFKIFYRYIFNKHIKSLKYLMFYVNYYNYQEILSTSNKKINSIYNENKNKKKINISSSFDVSLGTIEEETIESYKEKIRQKAKEIYDDFFNENNSKNSSMIIEFPIDMSENVLESYNNNFNGNNNDKIFDDPFSWVKEKLIKIFDEYINSIDEIAKMKKILFFIDCFEENDSPNNHFIDIND